MNKSRLEAFSDGVLAIIITIMVLDLRPPHEANFASLQPLLPVFASYVISFVYVGIYWNNHHHLFQAAQKVTGSVLWANLHLLFWLSLFPFATAWMGDHVFASAPVAFYGVVLLGAAFAYRLLVLRLLSAHDKGSVLAKAIGSDFKGNISLALYALGIPLSFLCPWYGLGLYTFVAVMWLVPDRRIEKNLDR